MNGSAREIEMQANVNDTVSYEDRANPRREFVVLGFRGDDYELLDPETGEEVRSDLRQAGWTLVHRQATQAQTAAEVHATDCKRPGFRYGLTRADRRVVMFCKNQKCPARRVV